MRCKKCGRTDLPEGSIYCNYCGTKQAITRPQRKRGNGQGCAVKRSKTWSAIWTAGYEVSPDTHQVKQIRKSKSGFTSKSAALAYAAEMSHGTTELDVYKPTVADYFKTWQDTDYQDLSNSKQCAFRIAWRKLEELSERPVSELTIAELQACVDDQADSYYPARDMRTLLSHIYKRAVAEGQARTNLAEFIRIPPLQEKERQPFTPAEVQALWDQCAQGDRMAEMIILMIYSGMMPGELKRCKVDMIDLDKREIIGCGMKTKKRKETPIIYPEAVSPIVEHLCATTPSKQGYIIGMAEDSFYSEYHAALKRAGVRDLPPYSCRHTTATALAMAKTAPSIIQEIMRHTKFATTQRYIHPDMQHAHEALNALTAGPTMGTE